MQPKSAPTPPRKVSVPATIVASLLLLASAAGSVAAPVMCAESMLIMGVAGLFGGSGTVMLETLGSLCALATPAAMTFVGLLLTLLKRPGGGSALALLPPAIPATAPST